MELNFDAAKFMAASGKAIHVGAKVMNDVK